MRALILTIPLALCACAVTPPVVAGQTLPPQTAVVPVLANSVGARQAIITALKAFRVAIAATRLAVQAGAIKPGTPRALQIASLNDRINASLQAANVALDAGSETSYEAAIKDAQVGLNTLQAAIGGGM